MVMPMPAHLTSYLIMLPLLAWMIWRRISRQFGRQPIQRKRTIFRIAMLALLVCMLLLAGLRHIELAEGLLGGLLVGGAIGLLGLRLTRFLVDPVKGDCYVPNPWIGGLLTLLVLGRLLWRLMAMWHLQTSLVAGSPPGAYPGDPMAGVASSPLTMLVLGVYVGYYLAYYTGLLIHHRRFQQSTGTAL